MLDETTDDEIEDRLNKLKFFNKVWNSGMDSNKETDVKVTEPKLKETVKIDTSRQPKISSNHEALLLKRQKPVYSSNEDADRFNNWYLSKISKENSNPVFKPGKFPDDDLFDKVVSMEAMHDMYCCN